MSDEIEQRRLEQRQRARRRMIGVAVFAFLLVAIVPRILEREAQPVARDVPVQVPPRDGTPAADAGPPALPAPGRISGGRIEPTAPAESSDKARENFAEASGVRPSTNDASAPPRVPEATVAAPAPAPTAASAAAEAPATPPPEPVKAKSPAAAEAPRSASAPAPAGGKQAARTDASERKGGILVQVGVFADADKARQLRSRLAAKGFHVTAATIRTGAGTRIRVRVGPYANAAAADKAVQKLAAMNQSAIVVKP